MDERRTGAGTRAWIGSVTSLAMGIGIACPVAASAQDACPPLPTARGGSGQIIATLTEEQADTVLRRTQATVGAPIGPRYRDELRVLIDRGVGLPPAVVLVPDDMRLSVGDRVAFDGGRADPESPCAYVPRQVTRRLRGRRSAR